MHPVIVDISQLCADPVRTGVQRVVRALIRDLPERLDVAFACFDPQARSFRQVDGRALEVLVQSASWEVDAREVAEIIRESLATSAPLTLDEKITLFLPEVFYNPQRLNFVCDLRDAGKAEVAMIAFDFAPYFKPDVFRIEQGGANFFIPYLRLLRTADARAFISQSVQDSFQSRILRATDRPRNDVVAVLGADSLPVGRKTDPASRDAILCVGSFDGKKKQDVVYEAFVASKLSKAGFKLRMLGAVPKDLPPQFQDLFAAPEVQVVDGPTDPDIVRAYETAVASVFIGVDEGYGLPAVESLFHGVPIIAYSGLPAIHGLQAGVVRLDDVTVEPLKAIFDEIADVDVRQKLMLDAASARLPTWDNFATCIADWLKRISSEPSTRAA